MTFRGGQFMLADMEAYIPTCSTEASLVVALATPKFSTTRLAHVISFWNSALACTLPRC